MDESLKAKWAAISDPVEALRELVEHETFLGYDPYYGDLRAALMEMAERCAKSKSQ